MSAKLRIVIPSVGLLTPKSWFEDMGVLVETCGRTSHKSEERAEEGSADKFISKIAFKLGHESITEHVGITVRYICSRAMSHQLVRHRIAAYTQESQRYCDYSNDKKFSALSIIVPPSIQCLSDDIRWRNMNGLVVGKFLYKSIEVLCYQRDDFEPIPIYPDIEPVSYIFFNSILTSYESYLSLRERKVPPEDARFVLPNASKTEVATTYNIREWRHVFKTRLDPHAQWEIRLVMKETLKMFLDLVPVFFEDLKPLLDL